jgi:hypothetical protein
MKVMSVKVLSLAAGALVLAWLFAASEASATLAFQKKAKELGIVSVQNCQSCHVDKLPKKETHKLNDRGQWLADQKEKHKAKEIDVAWLKDYVEKTPK